MPSVQPLCSRKPLKQKSFMKLPSTSLSELLVIGILVKIPLEKEPEIRTSGKCMGGLGGHSRGGEM